MTVKQQMDNLDSLLDEYENSAGLGKLGQTSALDNVLDGVNFHTITEEEANAKACELAQIGLHIQRTMNKDSARAKWADSMIIKCYEAADNGRYASKEEKKSELVRNNEYARKLEDIRQYCQARVDRLTYVAQRVDKIVDTLIELARTKRAKARVVEREDGRY
jgi:hypothetical protein